MSIGNWATSRNYSKMKPDDLVGPLRKMKASSLLLFKKLQGDPTPGRVIEIVRSDWGLDITMKDAQKILKKMAEYREDPYYAFGEVLSPKYLSIGWSTHGHCGGDVPLGAFGPNRPSGLLDAPEIAQVVAEALGVNLEALTRRLFTEASAEFGAENVTIDSSNPGNSVIRIRCDSHVFLLPVNKNLLIIGDQVYPLEGVTVLIPETQKAYIPHQAVKTIKGKADGCS
jgi:alkaline phosphatase